MKIKEISHILRPREKIIRYGAERVSTAELLGVIIGSGNKEKNAVELGKLILQKIPEQKIPQASIEDLIKIRGLGPAKAAEIVACFELGRRFLPNHQTPLILNPEDLWHRLVDIRTAKKEHFLAFYLNSRHQEIHRETISIGTLNSSIVHPREVFEPAITHLASEIILVHNHPSGDPTPSDADLAVTRRLIESGQLLGIEITDHIIITANDFYSFRQHSLLNSTVTHSN